MTALSSRTMFSGSHRFVPIVVVADSHGRITALPLPLTPAPCVSAEDCFRSAVAINERSGSPAQRDQTMLLENRSVAVGDGSLSVDDLGETSRSGTGSPPDRAGARRSRETSSCGTSRTFQSWTIIFGFGSENRSSS